MMEEETRIKGPCFFNHSSSAHTCDCLCTECCNADDKFATLPFYRRKEIMAAVEGQSATGGSS